MTAKEELFDYLQKHIVHIKDDEASLTITRTIDLSDKICAALEEESMEATKLLDSALAEHGLMNAPLDANGTPVHLNDTVHANVNGYPEHDFRVVGLVFCNWSDGGKWWVYGNDSTQYLLSKCKLVQKPSVKDLLYEMYDRLDEPSGDDQSKTAEEIIAEYVEKLQLRGDD